MNEEFVDSAELDEAREYLAKVLEELKKRSSRLIKFEEEMRAIEFELSNMKSRRDLIRGDVVKIKQAEAYKRKLRSSLEKFKKQAHSAREDLQRAEERKVQAEEDLALLEEGGEVL